MKIKFALLTFWLLTSLFLSGAQLKLTTTGTPASVDINDLGYTFTHPIVDLILYDTLTPANGLFPYRDVKAAAIDLQAAFDGGELTFKDTAGSAVTNIASEVDGAGSTEADPVIKALFPAEGDLLIGTSTPSTPTTLTLGTSLQVLRVNTGGTTLEFANPAAPAAHDLGGAEHNADTLSNFNAKISDATVIANTSFGSKGLMLVGTGASAVSGLSVGADNTVLSADSAELTGVKWVSALLADGSVPLTADWDVGAFDLTAEQFHSDALLGTAPFTVVSATLVANLNADLLDTQEGSYYLARANHTGTQVASTISDFDTEVSNNTSVAANTNKVTNATHSGDAIGDVALTIQPDVVSYDKMQDTTATDLFLGRDTVGGGTIEEILPAAARIILNVADGATANDTDANLKARANHTGTQAAATIVDFDTEVSNNTSVAANTTHRGLVAGNPHVVTKAEVGLGSVPNSDHSAQGYLTSFTELDTVIKALFPAQGDLIVGTGVASTPATLPKGTALQVLRVNGAGTDLEFGNTAAAPVDSVNTFTGAVVLDADDLSDAATTNKFATAAELSAIATNSAKVSADGLVTTHSDVTSAGSGIIISAGERTDIGDNKTHAALVTGNPHAVTKAEVGLGSVPNSDHTAQGYLTSFTELDTVIKALFPAQGDLIVGTGVASTPATLPRGTALQVLRVNGAGTDLEFAAGSQNLWATITATSGAATANTTTDNLTVVGASGITTAISGDILTITGQFSNLVASRLLGRGSSGGSGPAESLTIGSGLVFGGGGTILQGATASTSVVGSVELATTAEGTTGTDTTRAMTADAVEDKLYGTGFTGTTLSDNALLKTLLQELETPLELNVTHRTSDGSDHTFIDQSVIIGSSPTFDGTNITGITALPTVTVVEVVTNATTTSTALVNIPSLEITPAVGTYMVWLSVQTFNGNDNNGVKIGIAENTTDVAASLRFWDKTSNGDEELMSNCLSTMALITVGGSDVIRGRFAETGGGTASIDERTLTIMKVQ